MMRWKPNLRWQIWRDDMKISMTEGGYDCWHDYEILLNPSMRFVVLEGFNIPILLNGREHALWIRKGSAQRIKFMDKYYEMAKPKDFIALKGIVETEIALANLD